MSDDSKLQGVYVEYVAVMACMGLYGITCMQTYVPSSSFLGFGFLHGHGLPSCHLSGVG